MEFIGVHSLLSLLDLEIQLKKLVDKFKVIGHISNISGRQHVQDGKLVGVFLLLLVVIVVPLELKRCGYLTADASRICWR